MLEETHRRIAKEIAKELSLGEREAGLLEAGSVNPDSWANFPHHYGKELEIVRNILDARRLFLQGDDECYFRLGIALHYIQDRWTLRPRMKDKHTRWEMNIEHAPIMNDPELVKFIKEVLLPTKAEQAYLAFLGRIGKGVESIEEISSKEIEDLYKRLYRIDVYRIFEDQLKVQYFRGLGLKTVSFALQERPTTWSNPVLDINFSYRICLEVARQVFSREHNKGDWYHVEAERHDTELAREERRRAERRGKDLMTAVSAVIFIVGFILFIAGFTSFISADYRTPGHVVFGSFLGAVLGLIWTILGVFALIASSRS